MYKTILSILFLLISFENKPIHNDANSVIIKIANENIVYNKLNSNNFILPKFETFSEALKRFNLLKEKGLVKKNILTLIDFTLSSNTKRFWVINLDTNTIIFCSYVAHGRNTGDEFASTFSNNNNSFKSSLGGYTTGEVYNGKHGKSLRLDGLERGINDNARERGIVIHAADYVSDSFIRNNKRLGRSQGCPALPYELAGDIIDMIKNKSFLFIYYPKTKLS
jgi:hypothetical protein